MSRVIATIAVSLIVVLAAGSGLAQHGGHVVSTPDTLKWVEPPTFPGARLAIVQGDPSKEGLFVYRVKLPANYKIAPHTHKASENVTVLSGVFFVGMGEKFDQGSGKELPIGGFVAIPPQHPHFAWAGKEETVVQVHGVGTTDIRFVNPADDPRKKP
jgi:quercetin dioxygenase-like cupin family protein